MREREGLAYSLDGHTVRTTVVAHSAVCHDTMRRRKSFPHRNDYKAALDH